MPTSLDDRLHHYRATLDDAVSADRHRARTGSSRSPGRGAATAAAGAMIVGAAGLIVAFSQTSGPKQQGSAATVAITSPPGSGTSPLVIDRPSPTNGLVPRLILDDPAWHAVELLELLGDVNPHESSTLLTYLSVQDDGSVQRLDVSVQNGGAPLGVPNQPGQLEVRGHPVWVLEGSAGLTLRWQEEPAITVMLTVAESSLDTPGALDDARRLAEDLRLVTDDDWAELIDQVQSAPLPEQLQLWRDLRIAAGHTPVSFETVYG